MRTAKSIRAAVALKGFQAEKGISKHFLEMLGVDPGTSRMQSRVWTSEG